MLLVFSKSNNFLGKTWYLLSEMVTIANTISHTKQLPKQTISNKQILSINAE